MIQYRPHGTCSINVEGNLMIIRAQGPWNQEYIDRLHKDLLLVSKSLDINNYGILLNLCGEALAVESGFKKHLDFVKQAKTKAIAMNLSDCSTREMTKTIFTKLYDQAKINNASFTDESEAKAWLLEQLHNKTTTN